MAIAGSSSLVNEMFVFLTNSLFQIPINCTVLPGSLTPVYKLFSKSPSWLQKHKVADFCVSAGS